MNGMLRVPRSRGVLSGLLLVLLGAWGALVPFVGPYFHYAYTPDHGWTYTTGRFWLEVLPGAVTVLGGLIVLISASRPLAHFGAWLAALGGAWFALGSVFTGLGVVIVLVAGMALGRFSVIGVRDARLAAPARKAEPETPAEPAESPEPVTTGAATRTGASRKPATADTPATTGTGSSRRFALRRKEATTETAEPVTEPVGPSQM